MGNALLFFVYLRVSSFQLVAPRQTCLRKAVLLSQLFVFVKRLSLKINFQTSFAKPNNLRLYRLLLGLLSASAAVSKRVRWKSFPLSVFRFPFVIAMSFEVMGAHLRCLIGFNRISYSNPSRPIEGASPNPIQR